MAGDCLHTPTTVSSFYSNALENGHPTFSQACPNHFIVEETYSNMQYSETYEQV